MGKANKVDLLHTLFPHARAELLRLLFRERAPQQHVRGLARESGFSLSTTQHELKRLVAAGLVLSHTDGFHRFHEANGEHRLCPILRELVRIGAGDRAFVSQRKRPRRRRAGRRRDPLQSSNFLTSLGTNRRPVA